jgi:hypothetical protein
MGITNDQYFGFSKINKWYDKYNRQFFEISGSVGTGKWELLQMFLDYNHLEKGEVCFLSFDQKQVLELAFVGYHAYYIYPTIYKYERRTDFDTLPLLNFESKQVKIEWKKKVRKKLPKIYSLIVITDSLLMSEDLIQDVASFGLPVVLLKDEMLLPSADNITFIKDPNVRLVDLTDEGAKDPLVYFATKIRRRERLAYGVFNSVSIIPKKQMSLYNLRYPDMTLTMTNELRNEINKSYRSEVLHVNDTRIITGEKVIAVSTLWNQRIKDKDNPNVRVYLAKGIIGNLTKVNKHALITKYINVDFKPDFYHETFYSLDMDRYYTNRLLQDSKQSSPDEELLFEYAYALPVSMGRYSFWDNVLVIIEDTNLYDDETYQRLLYTAITRARKLLTIVI